MYISIFCLRLGPVPGPKGDGGAQVGKGWPISLLRSPLLLTVCHLPSGTDWPLGAPRRFPVAWRLIWPAALCFLNDFLNYYYSNSQNCQTVLNRDDVWDSRKERKLPEEM